MHSRQVNLLALVHIVLPGLVLVTSHRTATAIGRSLAARLFSFFFLFSSSILPYIGINGKRDCYYSVRQHKITHLSENYKLLSDGVEFVEKHLMHSLTKRVSNELETKKMSRVEKP